LKKYQILSQKFRKVKKKKNLIKNNSLKPVQFKKNWLFVRLAVYLAIG
jgi:hypothetical protein